MNMPPRKRHSLRLILPLATGVTLVASFLLVGMYAVNQRSIALPLSAYASYDPASYGIPYEIGGFKILAIKTADNTACIPSGMMRITVASAQPDVQSFLANTGDIRIIGETLHQLPAFADVRFDLEFIGLAPWNPAQFMASNAHWNYLMRNGCIKLGPAIVITPTPDPYYPYTAAAFGFPDVVAGYRIISVRSPDNTACMLPNSIIVSVQPVHPSPDNMLVDIGNGDVIAELRKINPDPNILWYLEWGAPGEITAENRIRAATEQANWNAVATADHCLTSGPEINVTPDPFAPYDPATFGLPEVVAGYRIVAVQNSSNTHCMALNEIRLTIQAVDPSPDNPMVAKDGGDIIYEVKQLQPDPKIEWSLQYIMPVLFDRQQFAASMEAWNKEGCVKLGGPMPTDVPTSMPAAQP